MAYRLAHMHANLLSFVSMMIFGGDIWQILAGNRAAAGAAGAEQPPVALCTRAEKSGSE